jgi:hypothetical protein
MEVKIRGQMTIADIRQALFEQLHELETKYAVQFSRGERTSHPACQAGTSSDPLQHGAKRSTADEGKLYHGPSMIKQPHYIGLEEARQVLAEMGVALSRRQMKRAADMDARGRRELPFFLDPIEGKLKIEKNAPRHLHEGAARGRE